ncbi:DEAD/DEAH box helicase [Algoriphagus sp. H41]|uniref:DEAD/DEAH box helicase n=1 Tax=Algoriphagus oliviformis TaxID=2811231 RepID=A0ABS3BXE6_9BACT|nr:DEAD/DEAH box helicase [Algoriphagus oliviformis]MBN7809533.1 DEAD/DEAH box helicase [Algoriphagus oliviformis]
MYNSKTEQVIRNAPQIDGSETDGLPQYLTRIYARIVSIRHRFDGSKKIDKRLRLDIAELRKLANNLESLTVLNVNNVNHVSAAFVAGTAHHLLQLIRDQAYVGQNLDYQLVPAWMSSILLFLIGESPADAAEIAGKISATKGDTVKDQFSNSILLLASGQLEALRSIQPIFKNYTATENNIEAEDFLWHQLLLGLQQMAGVFLGITSLKYGYFQEVINLSVQEVSYGDGIFKSGYAGQYHLAILLKTLEPKLISRGIINVEPPIDIDRSDWFMFLQRMAITRPYLWENHFDAIKTGFLNHGNSAVLTFPTGAGKTTVAELKIASTMMAGRSVLYLVPTHALEDQINRDLKILFNNIDTDLLEIGGEFTDLNNEVLSTINVMTPERCLTVLDMSSESFTEIGLVVFDEFHLVNGREDRLDKRSLDAMYCLLRLFTEVPNSDFLLMSAMVENGSEIADWVSKITDRKCVAFTSNWKPTRQLQGCIVYPNHELEELKTLIKSTPRKKPKSGPPSTLKKKILATPHQIFSLRNIWDASRGNDFFIGKLSGKKVNLGMNNFWSISSNRNQVAAELASFFVNSGIKTLVFVNNPIVAKSTSKYLNELLDQRDLSFRTFSNLHSKRMESLNIELGDLKHSFFSLDKQVATHHGLLLPVERQLNELLFKSKSGINAIVATATLAQGINLPVEVVIIAGDDRFDEDTALTEKLLAHEILNVAGRAGRAGTAAQGVVLIVPGNVIAFENKSEAPDAWVNLQKQIFSKSDQCLTINDPLTRFLDEVSSVNENRSLSQNAKSLLFRLHTEENARTSTKNIFSKSFAWYKAEQTGNSNFFDQFENLIKRRESLALDLLYDEWVEIVSLKTGFDPKIIEELGNSLEESELRELLGFSLRKWIYWFLTWLRESETRVAEMFPSLAARAQLARVLGFQVTKFELSEIAERILSIEPILTAFVEGESYLTINNLIPGKSDDYLTKARHFILRLVPQISFAMGAVSLTFKERLLSLDYDQDDIPFIVKNLATLIREGLDTQEKLQFKMENRTYLRVQIHNEFKI